MRVRSSLWVLLASSFAACAPPPAEPDAAPASASGDITTIEPSPGVQQSIPNCWVFATTAWIEALSARPSGGVPVDLSEAYVSYLWWFEQIVKGPVWEWGGSGTGIDPTGWWSIAVELVRRYGWMTETTFLSLPSPVEYARRHDQAINAIRRELWSGDLSTPAQRADRKRVVRVMNRAWGLAPEIAGELASAFGEGYERTLLGDTAPTGARLHRLAEVGVGWADGHAVTVADFVGTPKPGASINGGQRIGPYAFSEVAPPDADGQVRDYVRRAQKALYQDLPLVIREYSDDSLVDAKGTYEKPANLTLGGGAYAHVVMVYDLSVETPGFGLLPAGVPETRPDALAASLGDDARPIAYRARNSFWGNYAPGASIAFADGTATNDFAMDYLFMPYASYHGRRVLLRTTLPNDPDLVVDKAPGPSAR